MQGSSWAYTSHHHIAWIQFHPMSDQTKISVCKRRHNFLIARGCITFHLKSSGMVFFFFFTLYAHHPYIPTVPKTWSGVFEHIVYWNDHRVNTLDLFWNRKWRGVTGCTVHIDKQPPTSPKKIIKTKPKGKKKDANNKSKTKQNKKASFVVLNIQIN